MKRELVYNARAFTYELTRKRVKRINARVDRAGKILVSAPPSVKIEIIDNFILANAKKLLATAERVQAAADAAPRANDGVCLPIWGKTKHVEIKEGGACGVCEREDALIISLPKKNEREAARLLSKYLEKVAKEKLTRIFDRIYEQRFSSKFEKPALRFRRMRASWGNYRRKNRTVTLNLRLVFAPEEAAEYVILHELVHVLHFDHSPAFWACVARYMGDYPARRALLKDVPIAFDHFL